jgi:hypothetical protein
MFQGAIFSANVKTIRLVPDVPQFRLNGETRHLTPALSPFCSADSAKRGEGETFPAYRDGNPFLFMHVSQAF